MSATNKSFAIPDDEEYKYGEEKSERSAHDAGDDSEMLLKVDKDH